MNFRSLRNFEMRKREIMKPIKSKSPKNKMNQKESIHMIPQSKVARGRRPHNEPTSTPTIDQNKVVEFSSQEHSFSENSSEMEVSSSVKREASISDEQILKAPIVEKVGLQKEESNQKAKSNEEELRVKEEVTLEGQPAPIPPRTKVDLKHQIENVKGMVQMGTAIMKSSFPKPFEIAEKVVENWKEDGDFSELPIEQPLLQFYLGLGLRKAKQTEKELEQKLEGAGVLPVFRQQWKKAQKFLHKK